MNDEISRRQFIEKLAYSTLGVTALTHNADALETALPTFGKARRLIVVTINGGLSHTASFDPKDHPNVNGGIGKIRTSGDFELSEFFPELSKHGNHFSVIRNMSTKSGAHSSASKIMRTSYAPNGHTIHPSVSNIIYFLKGKQHGSIPDSISISPNSDHPLGGYLPKQYSPVVIVNPLEGLRFSKASVEAATFSNRLKILEAFNKPFEKSSAIKDVTDYHTIYEETLKLMNSKDLELFDLSKETEQTKDRYGKNQLGYGCLLAKRLVSKNVRAVEVSTTFGVDFHNDLQKSMETRMPEIDKALAALFDDLTKDGLLKDTLVVVNTEFGRTSVYAKEGIKESDNPDDYIPFNVNQGRDHQASSFSVLIGGCCKTGLAIGNTGILGNKIQGDSYQPGNLNATVGHYFGIKPDFIFNSPEGRPFTIGNHSNVIKELI